MLNWDEHAHTYQRQAAEHLWNSSANMGAAALWLDPGYGKTMIVLHAFKALFDAGLVSNMLIVAPLRVIQTVWAQEIENWSSLNGLVAARLHGPKKDKWLKRRDVNIWLLNYEGIPWLSGLAKKGKLDFGFDVVTFDEVRRMKNAQGKRFKQIRPLAALAKYRWGLTGTPASNGLMDLFGQFLIIDKGAALGTRITHYRHEYFEKDYDGFSWLPRPGAQERIEALIGKYIFRAEGHLNTPPIINDDRVIQLDPTGRKAYSALKRDLITQVEGEPVTAANAAVLYGKLKQLANGRIYDADRKIIKVHEAKKDSLIELVEELGAEQLLIAVDFHHDIDQIREVLGDKLRSFKSANTTAKAEALADAWNNREVQFIADHPESIGHGLNLQKGGAHHILWWSPTVNLDHWIQFNQRLDRQGNPAETIVIHQFVTEQSVNESDIQSRGEKNDLQSAMLNALTAEFGDNITLDTDNAKESDMTELSFKPDATMGQPTAPAGNPFAAPAGQAPAPQAAAPVANPFAAQPAQTQAAPAPVAQAPAANPFAAPAGTPAAQTQAIQAAASAPAPATPEMAQGQAPANPFAAPGAQAPVEDAQVVSETPAPVAQAPAPVAETPAPVAAAEPAPAAPAPAGGDTGWQEPAPTAPVVPEGFYVHVSMMVPESKHADVIAAIGRVLKK